MESSNQDGLPNKTLFELWSKFDVLFTKIYSENESEVLLPPHRAKKRKITTTLDEISQTYLSHAKYLVPSVLHNNYDNSFEECKCFNMWLFGQFIGVTLHSSFEDHKSKCLEAQFRLLCGISSTGSSIIYELLHCYITMLQDLCTLLEEENFTDTSTQPLFQWFRCSSPKIDFNFSLPEYAIRSLSQLTNFIDSTLDVLQSVLTKICHFRDMRTDSLELIWHCCLSLQRNTRYNNTSKVYNFTRDLILEAGLPDDGSNFSLITAELLLQIRHDISTLCQTGTLKGEDIFCSMLNTVSEQLISDVCYDYSYLNSVYCLLIQCPFLLSEESEETLLTYFNKLLEVSSDIDIEIPFIPDESSAQTMNLIFYARFLESCIVKQTRGMLEGNQSQLTVNVYESNKNWRFLIEQTNKQIQKIEAKTNTIRINQVVSLFNFVQHLTSSAVRIRYQFQLNYIFFVNEIHAVVTKLIKIMEVCSSRKILHLFFDITKNILMLPECLDYEEDKRSLLVATLGLPLPSFDSNIFLSRTFCENQMAIIDTELKQHCISSLMWIPELNSRYRNELCIEIFKNPSATIFESLPVLIHHLPEADFSSFQQHLLNLNSEVLTQLSPYVRKIVCALSKCSTLLKLPQFNTVQVHCRICDQDQLETNTSDLNIMNPRRQLINKFIFSVLSSSESACYNVLNAAEELLNHIHVEDIDSFLLELHGCFSNSDEKIQRKIVKIAPSILFKDLNLEESTVLNHNQFENYMNSLRNMMSTSLIDEDSDMQYCCTKAAIEIGLIPLEITLLPSVCILTCAMIAAPSTYSALARSGIEQIAMSRNLQEEQIYLRYSEYTFPLITHLIIMNVRVYGVSLKYLNFDYTSVFGPMSNGQILKYLLPFTIRHDGVFKIVTELAELTNTTVAHMFSYSFRSIFLHLLMSNDMEIIVAVLELIEEKTGEKICILLKQIVAKIVADLLTHYKQNEEKVKWCIAVIRKLLNNNSILKDVLSDSQADNSMIVSLVQHCFLGIIWSQENQLCSDLISMYARRQILSSLTTVIQLMGSSYITSVRFKLLFTLRTITTREKEKSPQLCIELWSSFVRSIEKQVLGPMLGTIFVSLLPFVDTCHKEINEIFRYLVKENKDAVKSHLHELYFVEKDQCDEETFHIINNESSMPTTLEDRLEWLLELCKHEIAEIKLYALQRLKAELFQHHKAVSNMIFVSDSVSGVISRILNVLVEGFRSPDSNIQKASGICLGEFGAIDPSYISNTMIKVNDVKKYTCYSVQEEQFVINTLTVLCRGFQKAKNNLIMDGFALAIQTTLKSYNVTDSENCEIWNKIPKNLREIIQPFHNTSYVLLGSESEINQDISHLIYSTPTCTTVQKWSFLWTHFLISLLPQNSKEKNIFQYFRGVISYDNECTLQFLPLILVQAVLFSREEDHVKIYEEMISVIRDTKVGFSTTQSIPPEENSGTQLVVNEELSIIRNVDQNMNVICVKTVFRLLDVLYKKHRDLRNILNGKRNEDIEKLEKFLDKFCKHHLAEKSFERKEYARSLLYMEEFLSENKNDESLDKNLAFLAKTYVYLNDVDNVKGLFAMHSIKLRQPQHVIMLHEITDQYQDAAICYQQLLRDADEERSFLYEKRMIQCYLSVNQPETALRFVNSLPPMKQKNAKFFNDIKCQALWNLSQFDELEQLTASKSAQSDDSWGVRIGQAVVHFLNAKQENLMKELCRIREILTKPLHMSSAAFGGYRECYEHVIKLHILNEFEKVASLVFRILENNITDSKWLFEVKSVITVEFDERLNKLQPISRVLQPVLNIRHVLFTVASRLISHKPALVELFNEEIRKCWLKVIEIANRTRNFQLAYSNIVAVENYQLRGFFIEKAKYYWEKTEHQEALRTLQDGLQFHYKNFDKLVANQGASNLEDRKICSEAMILIGTYNDTMVNTDLQSNLQYFLDASKVNKQSEKTLVKLAQYQDKILSSLDKPDEDNSCSYVQTVTFYGDSLKYGCEFIYQSMSRMLNIWIDFGNAVIADSKNVNTDSHNKRRKELLELNQYIGNLIHQLPTYYFFTAFSLIMSRMAHGGGAMCFKILNQIVVKCILRYPNQALWQFMSLHKSKTKTVEERFNKTINDPNLRSLRPIIEKFQQLFELCSLLGKATKRKTICPGSTQLNIIFPKAIPLLASGNFDNILIPAQKFLTIILPRSGDDVSREKDYNPFPEQVVYISRIRNDVHVYSSLQRPVRVQMVGTDGFEYTMIFKAMDDMRIDFRCMEFNSVINMYLKRDVEARDRALHIRTYTVLPLLDRCGVIEFIPNLQTMRLIIGKLNKSFGIPSVQVKQYECKVNDSIEKKRIALRKLVTYFPPLLHEWYKIEFPNPTSWYIARTAYTRTLAVMSIVGYMVGLGDRHSDNILLDSTNGDVVHVDFNILFNKGELLNIPERVPFRLTHSMIKAMGPLGYEGSFFHTCEIVNRILRNRKEQLISVLNTFLYDPPESLPDEGRACNQSSVKENLRKVELRFNGSVMCYNKVPSIPLSVEGQTRKLITEATDEDNLCQMFIGWSAYM